MNTIPSWVSRVALAAILVFSADLATAAEDSTTAAARPQIKGLPQDVPLAGTLITIDLSTNTAYLFKDGELVRETLVGTGTDKVLKKGDKVWLFRTPRGKQTVLRKLVEPVWRKPDWAYVEEGKPVPPPDSPSRLIKGYLGKYALDLGDGILIHGTNDPNSFGRKVSHGCIRVEAEALEAMYQAATVGTVVYIFESDPAAQTAAAGGGMSDLDLAAKAK